MMNDTPGEIITDLCGRSVRDLKNNRYTICAEKRNTMTHDPKSLYSHTFVPCSITIESEES